MTEPANSFQTLLPEHVLRRREKGEASFLHSKSASQTEEEGWRGRKRQKETKGRRKDERGETQGKRDTEVGHEKMWD